MDLHLWLGFAVASAAIAAVPGPGVMSIVGYAISGGRRVALASVAGLAVGNALAMTLSLAGVGVLLAASALAFSMVKWAGAGYLIGLGLLTILRTRGADDSMAQSHHEPRTARMAFAGNVAVGTFHPKTIVFFVAFVPQFIRPEAGYTGQATILIGTFIGVVGLSDTIYALAASRASALLRRPRTRALASRIGGGFLVASGVATAAARQ